MDQRWSSHGQSTSNEADSTVFASTSSPKTSTSSAAGVFSSNASDFNLTNIASRPYQHELPSIGYNTSSNPHSPATRSDLRGLTDVNPSSAFSSLAPAANSGRNRDVSPTANSLTTFSNTNSKADRRLVSSHFPLPRSTSSSVSRPIRVGNRNEDDRPPISAFQEPTLVTSIPTSSITSSSLLANFRVSPEPASIATPASTLKWDVPFTSSNVPPSPTTPNYESISSPSSDLNSMPSSSAASLISESSPVPHPNQEDDDLDDQIRDLTDKMEFVSFLSERRARNAFIKLPIPLASSSIESGVIGTDAAKGKKKDKKSANGDTIDSKKRPGNSSREQVWSCWICKNELGKLIVRDTTERCVGHQSMFSCTNCLPVEEETPEEQKREASIEPEPGEPNIAVYENSWSAGIDRELNLEPPKSQNTAPRLKVKKKRDRTTDLAAPCDVCTRHIATGSLTGPDGEPAAGVLVERICKSCDAKYRRCTDCGGRPEERLGVGKWRLKELFPDGKKSCCHPHRPLRNLEETTVDIWRVSELPQDEMKEYLFEMSKITVWAVFTSVALPDTIECDQPLAHDFKSAAVLASEIAAIMTPQLRHDVETTLGIRRYVSLRWHKPLLPKGEKATSTQSQVPEDIAREKPTKLVRHEHALHSWSAAELVLETGTICISLNMPRGVSPKRRLEAQAFNSRMNEDLTSHFSPLQLGRTYNAQTHICQAMLRRIQFDLAITNQERLAQNLAPYPKVHEVWLIHGYNKSSRTLNRSERVRGLIPLNEYLEKFGHLTNVKHFPPFRQITMPYEFLKRYNFVARRYDDESDLMMGHQGLTGRRPTNPPRRGIAVGDGVGIGNANANANGSKNDVDDRTDGKGFGKNNGEREDEDGEDLDD